MGVAESCPKFARAARFDAEIARCHVGTNRRPPARPRALATGPTRSFAAPAQTNSRAQSHRVRPQAHEVRMETHTSHLATPAPPAHRIRPLR